MMVDLKKVGIEPSRQIGVYAKPEADFREQNFEAIRKVLQKAEK